MGKRAKRAQSALYKQVFGECIAKDKRRTKFCERAAAAVAKAEDEGLAHDGDYGNAAFKHRGQMVRVSDVVGPPTSARRDPHSDPDGYDRGGLSAVRAGDFRGLGAADEGSVFREGGGTDMHQIAMRAIARTMQALRRPATGCGSSIDLAFDFGEARAAAKVAGANPSTMNTLDDLEGRIASRINNACGCAKSTGTKSGGHYRGGRGTFDQE